MFTKTIYIAKLNKPTLNIIPKILKINFSNFNNAYKTIIGIARKIDESTEKIKLYI